MSGKEENAPHMDKPVLRAENLITFAVKCESKSSDSKKPTHRKVHQLPDNSDPSYSSEEILSVSLDNAVNTVNMCAYKSKIFAHMEMDGVLVRMLVDSGASCNVLPRKFLSKDTVVDKTDVKLTTYSKANLKVLGVAKVSLRNPKNQKKDHVQFVIINEDYTLLLDSTSAQKMGLITVQHENIMTVNETVAKVSLWRKFLQPTAMFSRA